MAALPNSDDPNAPDRSRQTPSGLRRARPVHAAPPAHEDFDAEAGHETENAHAHEDEADWQRQLRRRRRSNLPGFIIAGVGALALAAGLAYLVSERHETKPGADSVATNVTPAPPLDRRSASTPSAPARVDPPVEPPRAAPPEPARDAGSTPSAIPTQTTQEPAQPTASPPEQSRVARTEPEPTRPTAAPPSSPSPGATPAPSAEVAGLLKRARELIEVGDIGAARLLLERAASANEGTALFALAETYDPAMLTRWRVQGVRPNVDRARALYQKALDRGVSQAQERLAALR